MTPKTNTLNVRMTESEYDELELLVELGIYKSKGEFIHELLKVNFDAFSVYIHEKAEKDREKHISLDEYITGDQYDQEVK